MTVFNPLDMFGNAVQKQVDSVRGDIERAVKVALLREVAATTLSRLVVLDAGNAIQYTGALAALQGGK